MELDNPASINNGHGSFEENKEEEPTTIHRVHTNIDPVMRDHFLSSYQRTNRSSLFMGRFHVAQSLRRMEAQFPVDALLTSR
jgi:hypothetical protein